MPSRLLSRTVQDVHDQLFVQLRQRDGAGERHAARLLALEIDLRRRPVQPDAHRLQLARQDGAVRVALARVQDHQDEVGALRHGDDLPPAALALRRALDDSRQIQQLLGEYARPRRASATREKQLKARR